MGRDVNGRSTLVTALRKTFFWVHLVAGLAAGLFILTMATTGLLISFERQILDWAQRDLRIPAEGARLSAEELLAKVKEADPSAMPSSLILKADPGAPAAVAYGREKTVYVNPATGALLGEGAKSLDEFFHFVTELHRWLALKGDQRETGKAITGAANLFFLTLVISGLIIWWPRSWRPSALRAVTWFDGRLKGKARDWNWHNVIGFWTCVPLFLIIITGAIMSYTWANDLLYRLTGNPPPPPRTGGGGRGPQGGKQGPPVWKIEGLNPLIAKATAEFPAWQTLTMRLPAAPNASISIEESHRGRPDKKATLTLDPKTAEVTQKETFASHNLGRQLRFWARWVHTGEAGGWIGQVIAALSAAGAIMLVWTGYALFWRRLKSRKARQAAAASHALEPRSVVAMTPDK